MFLEQGGGLTRMGVDLPWYLDNTSHQSLSGENNRGCYTYCGHDMKLLHINHMAL